MPADEKTKRRVVAPYLHINGTSAERLIEQLDAVYLSLQHAFETLNQAAPNPRDYYPVSGSWYGAERQHRRRLHALLELQDEIEAQMELIQAQQK